MASKNNTTHELDTEALISVNRSTFELILATPRENLVALLNALIGKGHLIIWNPKSHELISEGDIISAAVVNGRTVKIGLAPKETVDLQKWLDS